MTLPVQPIPRQLSRAEGTALFKYIINTSSNAGTPNANINWTEAVKLWNSYLESNGMSQDGTEDIAKSFFDHQLSIYKKFVVTGVPKQFPYGPRFEELFGEKDERITICQNSSPMTIEEGRAALTAIRDGLFHGTRHWPRQYDWEKIITTHQQWLNAQGSDKRITVKILKNFLTNNQRKYRHMINTPKARKFPFADLLDEINRIIVGGRPPFKKLGRPLNSDKPPTSKTSNPEKSPLERANEKPRENNIHFRLRNREHLRNRALEKSSNTQSSVRTRSKTSAFNAVTDNNDGGNSETDAGKGDYEVDGIVLLGESIVIPNINDKILINEESYTVESSTKRLESTASSKPVTISGSSTSSSSLEKSLSESKIKLISTSTPSFSSSPNSTSTSSFSSDPISGSIASSNSNSNSTSSPSSTTLSSPSSTPAPESISGSGSGSSSTSSSNSESESGLELGSQNETCFSESASGDLVHSSQIQNQIIDQETQQLSSDSIEITSVNQQTRSTSTTDIRTNGDETTNTNTNSCMVVIELPSRKKENTSDSGALVPSKSVNSTIPVEKSSLNATLPESQNENYPQTNAANAAHSQVQPYQNNIESQSNFDNSDLHPFYPEQSHYYEDSRATQVHSENVSPKRPDVLKEARMILNSTPNQLPPPPPPPFLEFDDNVYSEDEYHNNNNLYSMSSISSPSTSTSSSSYDQNRSLVVSGDRNPRLSKNFTSILHEYTPQERFTICSELIYKPYSHSLHQTLSLVQNDRDLLREVLNLILFNQNSY